MSKRMDKRKLITILFGVTSIISTVLSIYYLKVDKANANLSGLLTLSLSTCLITIVNSITLLLIKSRSSSKELLYIDK